MSKLHLPTFLTADLAAEVADYVFNILFAHEGPLVKVKGRREGCLVILVQSMLDGDSTTYPHLLYEERAGDKMAWERPFDEIALNMAHQLWQGRNSDGQMDSNAHLLFSGDTPYWGGVKRHGLVVAFSGQSPWFNQLIAGMVADMLKALAREALENSPEKAEGLTFLR